LKTTYKSLKDNKRKFVILFIYASSEKNRMLACRFGEHRDNSRNSQSVFLVVYATSEKNYDRKVGTKHVFRSLI